MGPKAIESAHPDPNETCRLQLFKYQEQGNLLDPHLEGIVSPLSGVLRTYASQAETGQNLEAEALRGTCQLLWTVVTVRYSRNLAGKCKCAAWHVAQTCKLKQKTGLRLLQTSAGATKMPSSFSHMRPEIWNQLHVCWSGSTARSGGLPSHIHLNHKPGRSEIEIRPVPNDQAQSHASSHACLQCQLGVTDVYVHNCS